MEQDLGRWRQEAVLSEHLVSGFDLRCFASQTQGLGCVWLWDLGKIQYYMLNFFRIVFPVQHTKPLSISRVPAFVRVYQKNRKRHIYGGGCISYLFWEIGSYNYGACKSKTTKANWEARKSVRVDGVVLTLKSTGQAGGWEEHSAKACA